MCLMWSKFFGVSKHGEQHGYAAKILGCQSKEGSLTHAYFFTKVLVKVKKKETGRRGVKATSRSDL
jgi:hypothetical protein